ncbi:MAG: cryptochrome/photolyase family protein [Isosphaeraceae bacterium]|nr:MAG: cryptochrome/photolyase family protein [Isosphaeraceae bacterium]
MGGDRVAFVMAKATALAWILPDQLAADALAVTAAERAAERVRVVLIESRAALRRLPYHKKRQVLILSAGRHYAEELVRRGYEVEVVAADDTPTGLRAAVRRHRATSVHGMAATEYAVRRWQAERASQDLGVPVETLPNTMFLVERYPPFPKARAGQRVVLEHFYRAMRRRFRLLMEPDGTPTGGTWNYDAENRRPLPEGSEPPPVRRFEPDRLTRAVMREVEAAGHGVGSTEGFDLAVTREEAAEAFGDFLANRLPQFGPYEDAMSAQHGVLWHSMLSPQMNLGLLEPLAMCEAAEAEYRAGRAPLNSVEGFIRQIVGWREFIYWQYHRQMPGLRRANAWEAERPMPALFWNGATEMRCLATVVRRLIETGYTHHIERLMLVCNFCLMAGVNPAEVADWFLTFYVDSHDWVVLPNVIGMGLNADGGITATKPYIASAAYVNRMSDFCKGCRFDPKVRSGDGACPFNTLYWNFLLTHEERLRASPRLGPNVLGLRHVGAEERASIRREAAAFLDALEPYETGEGEGSSERK